MGRMNQASPRQAGTDRYMLWYERFPLSTEVVEEMFSGQCKILNGLIFVDDASLEEFTLEDVLMDRFRSWLRLKD